jgi:hypothetical protein
VVMSLLFASMPAASTAVARADDLTSAPQVRNLTGNQEIPGIGTDCEEMTDSILRLYFAYFLRFPDAPGFEFWEGKYQSGWGLSRISEFFATAAPEFLELYGETSDEQFVDLLYLNVLDRDSANDPDGFNFWLGKLRQGIRRGTVMLSFSESQEFVGLTDTMTPLAGYLRWFPRGTFWACGSGNETFPLNRGFQFYDAAIWNNSGTDRTTKIEALNSRGQVIDSESFLVGSQLVLNVFNNDATGAATIRFDGSPSQVVTPVLYDQKMPADRPGWNE